MSHRKISPKPMISSTARLIRPETNTAIAGTRTTAMPPEIHRRRRGVQGLASMTTRIPRNESIVPDAPRSCSAVLTLRGTRPTTARCTPNDAMSATSSRATCVCACTAVSSCCRMSASSRRTRAANTSSRPPADIDPVLKAMPEKSVCVPSSLKCRRHHSWSDVVAAATAVPMTSTMTEMIARCRESGRRPRGPSEGSVSIAP